MRALTKQAMVDSISEQIGLSKRESKEVVEGFFQAIQNNLEAGKQVRLSGFGNFSLRDKSERPGRNPRTGEVVSVAARRVVTFHCGSKLRELIEYSLDREHA